MAESDTVPAYSKEQPPTYPAPTGVATGYAPAPASFQPQGSGYIPMHPMQQQQHTSNVTVVAQQPTMMPVIMEAKPDDHFVLSLLACLFCNWICGIVALVYSSEVNSAWAAGDYERARDSSKKARTWSLVAIISHTIGVVVGVVVVPIIAVAITLSTAAATVSSVQSYDYYN